MRHVLGALRYLDGRALAAVLHTWPFPAATRRDRHAVPGGGGHRPLKSFGGIVNSPLVLDAVEVLFASRAQAA
ncbi:MULTISPECIES: hypothetical protein [Myxococcus]|uniref:hypothetical protein n=1 Tax=Myxococcus TaxID=32 RepID=UPI000308460F|nr:MULTISPECIES: hypothetical protein [Myxococcus]NOJ56175.1 hypothetical protein [Myxococcus xanthus]QDE81988.1 hypothetical protein BHS07_10780 [Myxococcus xanthus]QDF03755.1 hypothetical protein BHS04_11170 [Myxococcus xanthus]QPM81801.1 hypothetical protein I5Q59_11275 [Myxococcus xanthus]QVW71051.1 hypothetical protein JTM82_16630 [Myxococcus xanthus DZ2]